MPGTIEAAPGVLRAASEPQEGGLPFSRLPALSPWPGGSCFPELCGPTTLCCFSFSLLGQRGLEGSCSHCSSWTVTGDGVGAGVRTCVALQARPGHSSPVGGEEVGIDQSPRVHSAAENRVLVCVAASASTQEWSREILLLAPEVGMLFRFQLWGAEIFPGQTNFNERNK